MGHVRAIVKNVQIDARVELECVGAQNVGACGGVIRVELLDGGRVGLQSVFAPAHAAADEFGAHGTIEQNRLTRFQFRLNC